MPDAPAGIKGISLFLVPKYHVQPDGSLGQTQRPSRGQPRAQAGHPRLAHLRHELWRRWRMHRRTGRPRERRPQGHVHDDELGADQCRRPGARNRPRPRHSRRWPMPGSGCSRPAPGRRPRAGADHRASRRSAHAAEDEGPDRGRAGIVLLHRRPGRSCRAGRCRRQGTDRPSGAADQGMGHRCRDARSPR